MNSLISSAMGLTKFLLFFCKNDFGILEEQHMSNKTLNKETKPYQRMNVYS